ncbi:expressed unknown protein [Seminavis robusta]|uniref:Uncharacterized protein n=1 Tax=Seminavis robusta TaxID=568900 RepID=A0A9N8HE77_9STRA|nr:expressed unknown protein [Seminavis robusta]|eukprot:Sro501_g155410.1 n/a (119) ;mRNA; r:18670-19026
MANVTAGLKWAAHFDETAAQAVVMAIPVKSAIGKTPCIVPRIKFADKTMPSANCSSRNVPKASAAISGISSRAGTTCRLSQATSADGCFLWSSPFCGGAVGMVGLLVMDVSLGNRGNN